MTTEEIEKLFDDNSDRMTKHHGDAMSKEKFIEVVSGLIGDKEEKYDGCINCMFSKTGINNTCGTCKEYSNYMTKF